MARVYYQQHDDTTFRHTLRTNISSQQQRDRRLIVKALVINEVYIIDTSTDFAKKFPGVWR